MLDKSEMIFGVRAVIEAIQAGKEIDKILVKKDIQSDLSKELFAALKGLLIPVQRVPVERINRITRKNHQGVVAFISSVTYQKTEDLISDLRFLQELQPDMIGIGPFITHQDTPFREFPSGELTLCLRMVAILRHLFPEVLLPATTALGTIHPSGRELGLLAGANVVMPNLSPVGVREKYSLYDNKICTGDEAAECKACMAARMKSIGYEVVTDKGDYKV